MVIRNADHYHENYNSCAKYKKANDSSWNAQAFFPSDMTQGQYISLQMSWKVKWSFLPYVFSLISFEPSTIDIKFERHRVPLVKTHRNIHADIERPKFNLRSRSRRVAWPKLHMSRCVLTKQTHWNFFMSLALLNLKLSTKNCCDTGWPQTTLAGSLINTWPSIIMNG